MRALYNLAPALKPSDPSASMAPPPYFHGSATYPAAGSSSFLDPSPPTMALAASVKSLCRSPAPPQRRKVRVHDLVEKLIVATSWKLSRLPKESSQAVLLFFPARSQAKGSCRSMLCPIHAAKIQTGLHRAEFAARLHRIFFPHFFMDF
jgi:hypothetical protein